jgi:cell wall-associated NlpC family hydrolase
MNTDFEFPEKMIAYHWLMNQVNLPYRWGGENPLTGYDCSGLVVELFKTLAMVPASYDATSQMLFNTTHKDHDQKLRSCKFGDLVFYGATNKSITHVGICINDNLMIEAGGGGSRTTTRDAAEKQNAWVRIRGISRRRDIVGYGRPKYPW